MRNSYRHIYKCTLHWIPRSSILRRPMKAINVHSPRLTPFAAIVATEASYPRGVARTRRLDVDQALAGRYAR
jgi:hypothetical protein